LVFALDGRPLQQRAGGVRRYLLELVPRLAAEARVVVLVDARGADPADVGADAEVVPVGAPPRLPGLAWLDLGAGPWLRRHGRGIEVDLFHGPYYAVPHRLSCPSVTTFHDIAWEVHPEDFGAAKRFLWRRYARHAARASSALIADSQRTADDIARIYGVPAQVIPIGRPDGFAPAPVAGPSPIEGPYVVAMGGARRRQLGEAVEAWRVARRMCPDLRLAVVGGEAPPTRDGDDDGIVDLGLVPDADWPPLLAGAEALLYATTFEGFGLPAIEAAMSATPCVCAPVGALPEVLGDAGTWAPEPTGAALGEALAALLADPTAHAATRAAMLARGEAAPTWDDAAEAHLALYRQVLR
jgi:glycosyltransferase involved in cell wall biosynthesis